MASDDLKVAHYENIAPFIRGYHAQQAVEKMLKAAFVVVAGTYRKSSDELSKPDGEQGSTSNPQNVLPCFWELGKVKFPLTHDIICLLELLRTYDNKAFAPLIRKQKDFMNEITQCAIRYRYPYFHKKCQIPVSYPSINLNEVVDAVDQLFNDLYDYICGKSASSQATQLFWG